MQHCNKLGTGSRMLNDLLGEAPFFVAIYGESGTGKSQLIYDALVHHAALCGSVLLIDLGGTPPVERLMEIAAARGYDAEKTLERILVIRVRDEESIIATCNLLDSSNQYKLIAVDNIGGLIANPFLISRLLLSVSMSVTRAGIIGIAAFQVRTVIETGESKPALYDYSWPIVDFFVKLERSKEHFTAYIKDKVAHFRVSKRGLSDL